MNVCDVALAGIGYSPDKVHLCSRRFVDENRATFREAAFSNVFVPQETPNVILLDDGSRSKKVIAKAFALPSVGDAWRGTTPDSRTGDASWSELSPDARLLPPARNANATRTATITLPAGCNRRNAAAGRENVRFSRHSATGHAVSNATAATTRHVVNSDMTNTFTSIIAYCKGFPRLRQEDNSLGFS